MRKERKTIAPKRRLKPATTRITLLLNDTGFTEYLRIKKKEENFKGLTELSKKFREIIEETRGK